MNSKVLLLLVGLFVGGIVGWFTKPADATFQLGPVNIAIQSNESLGGSGDGLTSEQIRHIGLIGALGGLIGLGLGVVIDSRRT